MNNTEHDLDPGIVHTSPNRRIISSIQLRNELMFKRESDPRESLVINLFTTNTHPSDNDTFRYIEDLQTAQTGGSLQFHYLINDSGFTYTGLELDVETTLGNGSNISIGLTGGGVSATSHTLSSFSVPQINALIDMLSQFAICYEKIRIERFDVEERQGLATLLIPAASLRKRVNKRAFNV